MTQNKPEPAETPVVRTVLNKAVEAALVVLTEQDHIVFGLGQKKAKDYHAETVRIEDMSDRQIIALFSYGRRAINDAYNSEAYRCKNPVETKKDPNPKPKPVPLKADWFAKNWPTFGTTWGLRDGDEAPLSVEEAGWIAFFKREGIKASGKTPDRGNLDACKDEFVRKEIAKRLTDKSAEEVAEILKTAMPKNREKILGAAEANTTEGAPGWCIEQERKMREPKKQEVSFTDGLELDL